MNLNELKDRAYQIACEHGWHDKELSDETYLMLIITEIAEAVNADRAGKHAQTAMFKANCNTPQVNPDKHWVFIYDRFVKNTVEDELADVVIRCLSMAGSRSIDLSAAMASIDKLSEAKFKKKIDKTFVELMFEIARLIFVEEELEVIISSVLICTVALCKAKGIDIDWHVNQKMRYNELRPYRHGGKAY